MRSPTGCGRRDSRGPPRWAPRADTTRSPSTSASTRPTSLNRTGRRLVVLFRRRRSSGCASTSTRSRSNRWFPPMSSCGAARVTRRSDVTATASRPGRSSTTSASYGVRSRSGTRASSRRRLTIGPSCWSPTATASRWRWCVAPTRSSRKRSAGTSPRWPCCRRHAARASPSSSCGSPSSMITGAVVVERSSTSTPTTRRRRSICTSAWACGRCWPSTCGGPGCPPA